MPKKYLTKNVYDASLERLKIAFEEFDNIYFSFSGGKDSAVVAALFARAIGSENVLGVTLPCHSVETDKSDAHLVADKYGFELLN